MLRRSIINTAKRAINSDIVPFIYECTNNGLERCRLDLPADIWLQQIEQNLPLACEQRGILSCVVPLQKDAGSEDEVTTTPASNPRSIAIIVWSVHSFPSILTGPSRQVVVDKLILVSQRTHYHSIRSYPVVARIRPISHYFLFVHRDLMAISIARPALQCVLSLFVAPMDHMRITIWNESVNILVTRGRGEQFQPGASTLSNDEARSPCVSIVQGIVFDVNYKCSLLIYSDKERGIHAEGVCQRSADLVSRWTSFCLPFTRLGPLVTNTLSLSQSGQGFPRKFRTEGKEILLRLEQQKGTKSVDSTFVMNETRRNEKFAQVWGRTTDLTVARRLTAVRNNHYATQAESR